MRRISHSSSSMSDLFTNRPLMRGLLSASFLRQSYLMRFRQIRILRLEWNLAIRSFLASGKYIPILPPLLSSSIGHAVCDVGVPFKELGTTVDGTVIVAAAAAALPWGMLITPSFVGGELALVTGRGTAELDVEVPTGRSGAATFFPLWRCASFCRTAEGFGAVLCVPLSLPEANELGTGKGLRAGCETGFETTWLSGDGTEVSVLTRGEGTGNL
mmetsp:Transcript_48378/g.89714  ORF Transcript_48378/g.89714 Transcript_48378/m.89714 type:complete len:215 (-) Transcript_48378:214-858(-)